MLAELLLSVSRNLLDGGRTVVSEAADAEAALRGLVEFHVDFALSNPDVIRVQDRDFSNLSDADQAEVRTLQRNYVELWVGCSANCIRTRIPPSSGSARTQPSASSTRRRTRSGTMVDAWRSRVPGPSSNAWPWPP
ncbi:hypothetical protein AHiyo8_14470 [Arthrobacter sp. Hiyo8]|nr:hypothetical protein AHiyo8_14470 [Arthrobacter sp. Hiyo8]